MSTINRTTLRRLGKATLFALVRGAAYAAGGAAVTAALWWARNR